jgi:hypothetical protein
VKKRPQPGGETATEISNILSGVVNFPQGFESKVFVNPAEFVSDLNVAK